MNSYVLDTNIIIDILRAKPLIHSRFLQLRSEGHNFIACPMIYYEIKRALVHRNARKQLAQFQLLSKRFAWLDYRQADWELAAGLWAKRHKMDLPIEDADLLIAAFTINQNAILITRNAKDFAELGLRIEDWSA